MSKNSNLYKSVADAELNTTKEEISQFLYGESEPQDTQVSWSDLQHSAPLPEKDLLNQTMFRRVTAMTLQGGNAFRYILNQSGAEAQYRLSMHRYKVMGLDRPSIHTHHRVPVPVLEKLVTDYAAGTDPISVIGKRYHVSPSEIYYAIDRLNSNVPRRQLHLVLSNWEKEIIKEEYANGKSINRVSLETKRGRSTVFNFLKHQRMLRVQKYTMRKPVPTTDEERNKILALHFYGTSLSDIAKMFNRKVSVVRSIIVQVTGKNLSDRHFVRITEDEKSIMKEMYENGCIVAEIARATKHKKDSVKRIVGQLPLEKYQKFSEYDLLLLRQRYEHGCGLGETAREFHRAKSSIKYYFDKFRRE